MSVQNYDEPYNMCKDSKLSEHYQWAVQDFQQFKAARYLLGREFLATRSRDEIVYVVFGKPYSLYDPELKKIRAYSRLF